MAHFALIDDNLTVLQVVVISNDDILDQHGNEKEELGVSTCEQTVGPGRWIQTSYNGLKRGMFAGVGFKYSEEKDRFYNPQSPYSSWVLNDDLQWVDPVSGLFSKSGFYWSEENQSWEEMTGEL